MSRTDQSPAGTGSNPEREWLVPSAILTAGLGLAALLLMPLAGYKHIPPYFGHFINWVKVFLFGGAFVTAVFLARQALTGAESPLRELWKNILQNGRTYAMIAAGIMLAGIDMLFFMWIKPEVTAVSPFWADDLLAKVDHAIFRTDPWRLFSGIDLTFHAWAYSFFWAVAIMVTLMWLVVQPPSRERSASLLNYFVLWSLFGPIGQFLGSAAGPIFYERVGLGDRFDPLHAHIPEITNRLSGYLWTFHTTGTLGVGAGISAMPSLHIATVTWIYLAFRGQRSRMAPLSVLFALYMWAMSVALGWHYAIDGIVGAAGAVGCHALCRAWLRMGERITLPKHISELPA